MILLDVGVWLAAIWGGHVHHVPVAAWLNRQAGSLLLCRVAQMGLLRLLSNPAVLGDEVLLRSQAWRILDELYVDSRIVWVDEPAGLEQVWRAVSARNDQSHKRWTDDYFAAFAQASGARLATLDQALKQRYPAITVTTPFSH